MADDHRDYFYSYTFWNPPLHVFALLNKGENSLLFEAHENYQKRSWRNRALIIQSQGLHTLSIPLEKGKNNKMPIRSVRISSSENWKRKHLRTIRTNYQSAPYFDHYFPMIQELYHKKCRFLWDWNSLWTSFWLETLHFENKLESTKSFGAPASSLPLWNAKLFDDKDLNTHFWYPQVHEEKLGFIRNVSIMDAMFCAGPETRSYLKTFFSPTFALNR